MELRHLRYFVALAEECHFGRAAQRLRIVQPTLSMQIQALEQELGGPLFTRTSRRVSLTEAGEVLLIEARRALEQADHAVDRVRQSINGDSGTIRVGFSGVAVFTGVLVRDLRRFHQTHREVRFELTELAPTRQVQAVHAGVIDVAYAPDRKFEGSEALRVERRLSTPLVAAVAADGPLAGQASIDLSEIIEQPLVLYSVPDGPDDVLQQIRRALGREPAVVHRVPSSLGVLAMAAAGIGVAIVPAATEQVSVAGLAYRRLTGDPMVSDIVLVSRQAETSGAVRAFLADARSHASATRRPGPPDGTAVPQVARNPPSAELANPSL